MLDLQKIQVNAKQNKNSGNSGTVNNVQKTWTACFYIFSQFSAFYSEIEKKKSKIENPTLK